MGHEIAHFEGTLRTARQRPFPLIGNGDDSVDIINWTCGGVASHT
jgi:hypothetical protein